MAETLVFKKLNFMRVNRKVLFLIVIVYTTRKSLKETDALGNRSQLYVVIFHRIIYFINLYFHIQAL